MEEEFVNVDGVVLSGKELEEHCRKNGLCHLCAKVRTHKRVFQVINKNKWQPLTVKTRQGDYSVYKGYCVKPGCFTLDQAKRLLGELGPPLSLSIGVKETGGEDYSIRDDATESGSVVPNVGSDDLLKSPSGKSSKGGRMGKWRRKMRRGGGASEDDDRSVTSEGSASSTSSGRRRRFGFGRSRSGRNSSGNDDDSVGSTESSGRRRNFFRKNNSHAPSSTRSLVNDFNVGDKIGRDDEMSVGSAMTDNSAVRRSLQQLMLENSGTVIDLSVTKLQHSHISELVSSFAVAKTLTTLILDKCKLNDNEVEMITQGLADQKEGAGPPLNKLSLRQNSIGNRGASSFTAWLATNTSLEELDVSKNQIGSSGAVALLSGVGQNQDTKLRMLNLAHNEIWDLGDGSFFVSNKSLKLLSLEGNFIHDEGVSAIANGIGNNPNTKLEKLLLGWNGIGDVGVQSLAQMLEVNQSLRTIGLAENEITSSGARAILSALASNTTLRDIAGLYHNQIERKFIVVAIKRLLHAHSEQNAGATMTIEEDAAAGAVIEEEQTLPLEPHFLDPKESAPGSDLQGSANLGASLRWEEKVFAPTTSKGGSGDFVPPHVAQVGAPESSPNVVSSNDKVPTVVTRDQPGLQNQTGTENAATLSNMVLPPERSYDHMSVIQSAPLAYFNNETNMHHAVPLHDFDNEAQVLRKSVKGAEKIGGKIKVMVETATAERLHNFFSSPSSRLLHLSCYGHPDYLAFENGFGYIHTILPDTMSSLVQAGGLGKLRVVFVLSYHAQSIGTALVQAGIPHVVCCHHTETFRDRAAIEFMRNFYKAAAVNKTLKEAFHMAQEAVRVEEITKRIDRYQLLPERPDDDSYHDIPVFFAETVIPDGDHLQENDISHALQIIPQLPQHYIGRESDMYEILESLRVDDVVRVGGPPGSGKKSVVAAVCRYVLQRKSSFLIDDVFWLPTREGVKPEEDTLFGDLSEVVSMMVNSTGDIWQDDAAMEFRDRIEIELEGKRTVLAIDGNYFRTDAASQNLEAFLSHLLDVAKVKIILIAASTKDGETPDEDETIHLGPLDFKSTSLLFGEISRFITITGCPAAQSAEEFAALIVPPSVARMADRSQYSSIRRTNLLARMGNGLPGVVIKYASRMPAEDFIDLIGMANSPEVLVDSGSALEAEIRQWTKERDKSIKIKNYLRAQDLEKLLQELAGLRSQFPSLDELLAQEGVLKKELASTLAARQYDKGNAIKRELLALKKLIMQEKRAAPEERAAHAADTLSDIQAQVKSMIALTSEEPSSEFLSKTKTSNASDGVSATFSIGSAYHNCALRIYCGAVHDFDPLPDSGAVVCWTNECCDLGTDPFGVSVIETGGNALARDIYSLPAISRTPWGAAKCGTGNAVIVGPGAYHQLRVHCVVLAVGPVSPSRDEEYEASNEDMLHYIEIMLRSCYRSSLVLAKHSQLQAIAFPTLTTKVGTETYDATLKMGLKCLVEEAKYSDLSSIHIVASSEEEAIKLIAMASNLGLSPL